MDTSATPSYRGYRFPAEIISHCVWLYFRFCLSFRDVQEMMLERGVQVSHEAIRLWTLKFGTEYARHLRRRSSGYGDTWHLEEVFCKINGKSVYLWRAVDQDGETLDVLVQKRRNARAAKRFEKEKGDTHLKALCQGINFSVQGKIDFFP
jgi:putative transposase